VLAANGIPARGPSPIGGGANAAITACEVVKPIENALDS